MSTIDQHPFALAQQAFAVANTPMFLIRKLRVDPEVHEIARLFDGEVILSQLEAALGNAPKSLRESVLPYVLLVSLSFKNDVSFLKATEGIARGYEDDWFDYARQVLLQTHRTTVFSSISAQPMPTLATPPSNAARSGANTIIIKASS